MSCRSSERQPLDAAPVDLLSLSYHEDSSVPSIARRTAPAAFYKRGGALSPVDGGAAGGSASPATAAVRALAWTRLLSSLLPGVLFANVGVLFVFPFLCWTCL